jgi:cytochrome c oxidase subunit 2
MRRVLGRAGSVIVAALLGLALPALAAANGRQDVLHPASHQEHEISVLWWVMLGGSVVGFAVICVLILLGWFRRHRESLPFGGGERAGTAIVVGMGVFLPIVLLTALFVWSDIFLIKTTEAPAASSTRLSVDVVGRQWFWAVSYPGTSAVTANEIHIPTHTRVQVRTTTADVIHSFWVPELNRKVDSIPGRVNRVLLDTSRVGTYRGQCAEFCGLQHAHMSMLVFADPPKRFRAWLANERKPARAPTSAPAKQGERLFMRMPCAGCHTIRGTPADGKVGPDLTHLAGRATLAAVTIPNDRAHLARWIEDPQFYKPGNKMPGFALSKRERDALVAYLESLR